ncbi:MAG TPA: phosphatidate cytidylyltransferase [Gammaproteobacteria bacterium]|nr:phosphatidate cytidylyltransferase [Gammaproteobacteria bacterium]
MAPSAQLQQRLLTAAVLVPLFLAAILWLPTPWVMTLFALVVAQGAWEWAGLAGFAGGLRLAYVIAIVLLLAVLGRFLNHPWLLWLLLGLALTWWLIALAWIRRSETMALPVTGEAPSPMLALAGAVVLVPVWAALSVLHANGSAGIGLLLTLLGIVWAADSGAYFSGRRWGRHRLAPRISPGKTREGAAGGVAAAVVVALPAAWLLGFRGAALVGFVLLAVVTALFSIVGDLLESLLKRRRGVKDSGHLLPGHGGVLDRIDSLTAAAPVYVLGLMLQEVRL